MTDRELSYYAARLRVELAAAALADNAGARAAHEGLAHLYAERIAGSGPRVVPVAVGFGGDAAGAR